MKTLVVRAAFARIYQRFVRGDDLVDGVVSATVVIIIIMVCAPLGYRFSRGISRCSFVGMMDEERAVVGCFDVISGQCF